MPFSLPLYLFVVCLLSWPFQFAYLLLGPEYRPLLLLSMIMAGIATLLSDRYLFGGKLIEANWRIGKIRYYVAALLLALVLWLLPAILEAVFGIHAWETNIASALPLLLVSSLLTVLPALGEEISWRAYLLPQLLKRYSTRRALLVHGLVTWFWHLPFLLAVALENPQGGLTTFTLIATVSLVPAVMHAVIFAWFWQASGSLILVTFYHVAFDEVRDALQATVGFSWLAENWQMGVIMLLGGLLLWQARWPGLKIYQGTTRQRLPRSS